MTERVSSLGHLVEGGVILVGRRVPERIDRLNKIAVPGAVLIGVSGRVAELVGVRRGLAGEVALPRLGGTVGGLKTERLPLCIEAFLRRVAQRVDENLPGRRRRDGGAGLKTSEHPGCDRERVAGAVVDVHECTRGRVIGERGAARSPLVAGDPVVGVVAEGAQAAVGIGHTAEVARSIMSDRIGAAAGSDDAAEHATTVSERGDGAVGLGDRVQDAARIGEGPRESLRIGHTREEPLAVELGYRLVFRGIGEAAVAVLHQGPEVIGRAEVGIAGAGAEEAAPARAVDEEDPGAGGDQLSLAADGPARRDRAIRGLTNTGAWPLHLRSITSPPGNDALISSVQG